MPETLNVLKHVGDVEKLTGEAMTQLYGIESGEGLALAVDLLQRGEIVAVPTDTVYGLVAPVFSPETVVKIYQVKQRPYNMALPVFITSIDDLEQICHDIPDVARRIAEAFWPGGVTIILKSKPSIPGIVNNNGTSVALRIPNHPIVPQIIDRLGQPLASTSANISGMPTPLTASGVKEQLEGRIPLVLDGGPSVSSAGSTIIDLTASPPKIVRQGDVVIPSHYLL